MQETWLRIQFMLNVKQRVHTLSPYLTIWNTWMNYSCFKHYSGNAILWTCFFHIASLSSGAFTQRILLQARVLGLFQGPQHSDCLISYIKPHKAILFDFTELLNNREKRTWVLRDFTLKRSADGSKQLYYFKNYSIWKQYRSLNTTSAVQLNCSWFFY